MALWRRQWFLEWMARPVNRVVVGVAVASAAVLVVAAGVLHGAWTGRWSNLDQVCETAASRLARLPKSIGEWDGQDGAMDERTVEKVSIAGYLFRRYTHRVTGETITVFVVCGRAGPVSVHTPDVCYRGAGYELIGGTTRFQLPVAGGAAEFWLGEFAKPRSPIAGRLRILWTWSAGGGWQAPDRPRVAFAGTPCLHKLYVVSSTVEDTPFGEDTGTHEFVKLLIPQLESALFAE